MAGILAGRVRSPEAQRHRRKLRIGALRGNHFSLVLREVSDHTDVEARLALIAGEGVPNYFGSQRFGRDGNNLEQARRWANDEIRVKDRSKRSFYLPPPAVSYSI